MTIAHQSSARDIVGSWQTPQTDGVALGYYFYPDGVVVLQNPRHRMFSMRGAWALEEDGRLVISDMEDPSPCRSEAERELIREERHRIAITELSPDSMVWQPEEAAGKVEFRRTGGVPGPMHKSFWHRLFSW